MLQIHFGRQTGEINPKLRIRNDLEFSRPRPLASDTFLTQKRRRSAKNDGRLRAVFIRVTLKAVISSITEKRDEDVGGFELLDGESVGTDHIGVD